MPRQYLVIGTGRFGSAVATSLYDYGHEVVAIDTREEAVEEIMNRVTHAAVMDATDERAMGRIGVSSFDVVVMAIGENLEAGILATVAAKTAGARYVISKANNQMAARILASVGADEVVRPEHDMGVRLARQIAAPGEIHALELGPDHSVEDVDVADRLTGTLAELDLPSRFGVQVIAVHRDGDIIVTPAAAFEVIADDRLIVVGGNDGIDRLRRHVAG